MREVKIAYRSGRSIACSLAHSLMQELHSLFSGCLWTNELILQAQVNALYKVGINMSYNYLQDQMKCYIRNTVSVNISLSLLWILTFISKGIPDIAPHRFKHVLMFRLTCCLSLKLKRNQLDNTNLICICGWKNPWLLWDYDNSQQKW